MMQRALNLPFLFRSPRCHPADSGRAARPVPFADAQVAAAGYGRERQEARDHGHGRLSGGGEYEYSGL